MVPGTILSVFWVWILRCKLTAKGSLCMFYPQLARFQGDQIKIGNLNNWFDLL